MNEVVLVTLVLVLGKWLAQVGLERLNQKNVRGHAESVPPAFKDSVDPATYGKSIEYTLAKSRLSQVEDACDVALLFSVLFSGLLPWAFDWSGRAWGHSAWALAAFLFVVGAA